MSEFLPGLPPEMLLAQIRQRQADIRDQYRRAERGVPRPARRRAAIARAVRRLRLRGAAGLS